MDRHVALAARAHDRRAQRRPLRVLDHVAVEAVEVSEEQMVALEREVRVREVEAGHLSLRRRRAFRGIGWRWRLGRRLRFGARRRGPAARRGAFRRRRRAPGRLRIEKSFRLRDARDQFKVARRLSGIAQARLEPHPWIGRAILRRADEDDRNQQRNSHLSSSFSIASMRAISIR